MLELSEISPEEFFARCAHLSKATFAPFAPSVRTASRKRDNPHYCSSCTSVFCDDYDVSRSHDVEEEELRDYLGEWGVSFWIAILLIRFFFTEPEERDGGSTAPSNSMNSSPTAGKEAYVYACMCICVFVYVFKCICIISVCMHMCMCMFMCRFLNMYKMYVFVLYKGASL